MAAATMGLMFFCGTAMAAESKIVLAYIELVRDRPPTLSNLDEIPSDEGLAGARLGIADNNTTGQFLNQKYELLEYVVQEAEGRAMRPIDYATWLAIRSVGEAVTRSQSVQVGDVRTYLLSDEFNLAGFKGRGLSFRSWNGQMRQPIPLTHPEAIVALAPLEGFLHQFSELDTLGLDRGETQCMEFE
ncbi:MAG: hypothetical protein MRY81_03280 [Donghicola eburneus]|uniref:hypothetical protein n=1 Tax=Primorskyibacter sp. 2E233 TaxID=3413431 RepID=UPI003BF43646|nr:hypothetical protein [Donghicola eburneus]